MKQFISQITEISPVAEGYFKLSFSWSGDDIPRAGQFLTLKAGDSSVPLLRRPFAFSSFNKKENIASVIFQVVGKGTEMLSRMTEGDSLDILGPLGNSFNSVVKSDDKTKKNQIVIAGGIGTGPMLFLADELKKEGKEPTLIIGCRNRSLVPIKTLDSSIKTVICTDDGSYGFAGNVVDYMKENADIDSQSVLYSCGPEPMLKSCQSFADDSGMSSYVSLEEVMACGVGACMGCTCETKGENKYARVCKDGPVFSGGDIKWK